MYFAVKVTSGQEKIVATMLQNKATKSDLPIYAVLVLSGLKGYIIVEAENEVACSNFVSGEHNIKGLLKSPLTQEEIDKILETKTFAQTIEKGDLIEFINGPFKGYKAKVLKIDDQKNDLTVELMDVVVPIPITTKISSAKVIQKAKNI